MIRFEQLTVTFLGAKEPVTVLQNANAVFPTGKIIALTGPSGSGKTTCLQLLAGLLSPTSGNIIRQTPSLGNVTHETSLSYLPQELALLPWLTAAENVNLVLSDKQETMSTAKNFLDMVELSDAADRYPDELSGGMKQRVALARALCTDADLLLLDEPFRGLDAEQHKRMRTLVQNLRTGKTTVLVSHDESDLEIADLVLHVENGTITNA